jgi:DNA repair protein RadC
MTYEEIKERQQMLLKELADLGRVRGPNDCYGLVKKFGNRKVEHFYIVTLNGARNVIKIHEITKGLVNRTIVHPREVFRPAITDSASSIILCHNHPSGNCQPSSEDISISRRLIEAGELIGINVVDHLIICKNGYISLLESGEVRFK